MSELESAFYWRFSCYLKCFSPSSLFDLARMGNTCDALRLIIKQLNDIHQAIEFCKTYDDPELWEQLIDYSVARPGKVIEHVKNLVSIQMHMKSVIIMRKNRADLF